MSQVIPILTVSAVSSRILLVFAKQMKLKIYRSRYGLGLPGYATTNAETREAGFIGRPPNKFEGAALYSISNAKLDSVNL
jgi:hypothetical protein